jgi:hypothetical protein
MDTSNWTEHPKKKQDISRRNEVKDEYSGSGNSSTDSVN